MRADFDGDLTPVRGTLTTMARAAREAMRQAGTALLAADHALAHEVTVRDAEIDVLYRVVEDRVFDLIARRQPPARELEPGDLRRALTAVQVAAGLRRMGDLAVHVARSALRRHPQPAVVPELTGLFRAMNAVADDLAATLVTALADADAAPAARLEKDDDAMDELHRRLFTDLVRADWPLDVEAAVDGALLGRYYERYADNAVNVGRHLVVLVAGANA